MPGFTRTIAAVIAALLLGGCASVPSPGPSRGGDAAVAAELAARFDSLRREKRIPGLSVVVLRDTTVVLARGFGLADVERQVAVTPETPFNVASVSKPISAVVALRLAADGLLDLDRPMRRYEGFAEFCADVRGAGGMFFGDYACEGERLTLRHVLSMTANGEPGTRFWYNPPSYSWASRPMAEVAGTPFSTLVDSLVFRPAGMRSSARTHRRLPLPADLAARLATPYHVDSAGNLVRSDPPPPQGDGAAGGVTASAMDLARFDVALTNGRLLAPEWRAKLWTPARTPSGAALPYGLGWFLGGYQGRRLAWHTGLWEGRYSALYLKVLGDAPGERLTLILLANSDALQWETRLDEAAIERSPFATAFLAAFPGASR
jgi:CubicO group peptidase (beta-lactamase class C family)